MSFSGKQSGQCLVTVSWRAPWVDEYRRAIKEKVTLPTDSIDHGRLPEKNN